MKQNALELFLKQKRFDLIFKYLYIKYPHNEFIKNAYIESIRAFNNFSEVTCDGTCKKDSGDFLNIFDELYTSLKDKGFDSKNGIIPVGPNGDITDGAHRLSACAYLNIEVETKPAEINNRFDYKFFAKNTMDADIMDFGALEYVKLNKNAYIVNLHSVTDSAKDNKVIDILEKYGFVYYKKDIKMSYNGYVNLKKLSYGSFWDRESWIGTVENKFKGAQGHAKSSMGRNPLRVFVFVCDDLNKVIAAKKEIRDLYNIGNSSVHINDTREEAIWLAETYFNNNSLEMINSRPFVYETPDFDSLISELKNKADECGVLDFVCASGSTPLNIYGIRESRDLDYLYCGTEKINTTSDKISNHDTELDYYPYQKEEIIFNPQYHFYYHGLKFITLDILYKMKLKRNEKPKDVKDCKLITKFKRNNHVKYGKPFKLFEKKKNGKERHITILGFIKFSYTKK